MTPEERFERIERNLEVAGQRIDGLADRIDGLTDRLDSVTDRLDSVTDRLNGLTDRIDALTTRMDAFETSLEVQNHRFEQHINKLWEGHTVIMDSQNRAWDAIGQLAGGLDKLSGIVDRFIQGTQKPNGNL